MLGKLIKYELKATSRTFLLLYIAVIFLAVVNRIFFAFESIPKVDVFETLYNLMVGTLVTVYILMIIAMFVAVLIIVIQRFYKNLFGDEGYLMLTLPVKSWEHIVSKALTASIWLVASTVVTAISVLVLISIPDVFRSFSNAILEMINAIKMLDFSVVPFVIEFIAVMLLSVFGFALPLYACISIGQLWKKHRVLGAFCAYFVMSTITQIISSVFISVMSVPMFRRMDTMVYGNSYMSELLQYIHSIMIVSIVLSVVFYVAYFFITKYVLEKKIDLE